MVYMIAGHDLNIVRPIHGAFRVASMADMQRKPYIGLRSLNDRVRPEAGIRNDCFWLFREVAERAPVAHKTSVIPPVPFKLCS